MHGRCRVTRVGVTAAACVLVLAFTGVIYKIGREHARTAAELAQELRTRLEMQHALDQAQEAVAVHRAHLRRADDERREIQTILNDLQQMEGRNAPLSTVLRATVERLYVK